MCRVSGSANFRRERKRSYETDSSVCARSSRRSPQPKTDRTKSPRNKEVSPKFEKLKSLLRELFQLDQPDLDFGLYRLPPRRLPASDQSSAFGVLAVMLVPAPRRVLAATALAQTQPWPRSSRTGPATAVGNIMTGAHGSAISQGIARGERANVLLGRLSKPERRRSFDSLCPARANGKENGLKKTRSRRRTELESEENSFRNARTKDTHKSKASGWLSTYDRKWLSFLIGASPRTEDGCREYILVLRGAFAALM